MNFERCFIMLCNWETEQECIDQNLFGDKANRFELLQDIEPGDFGFLLNIDTDELIGVFQACSEAQLHVEPKAWKGKFPAQVRVKPIGKVIRIADAAYILGKAGVGLRQLASGLPGPQEPVQGRDVGEKLLVHFGESTEWE